MDRLVRMISDELNLRIYTAETLNLTRELTALHETSPNASFALGYSITAAALMSSSLKPGSAQSLSLSFTGNGPLQTVHVQADAQGHIRGYVGHPVPEEKEEFKGISFSQAIGAGFLTVKRDLGLREPYQSVLPLLHGDVATEVAAWYRDSEQVPSALILAMEMDSDTMAPLVSAGILIQAFPDTDEEVLKDIEEAITTMDPSLGEALIKGESSNDVASRLLGTLLPSPSEITPLAHTCSCSRERIEAFLKGLGKEDRESLKRDDGAIEVICTFCREKYLFSESEISQIII